MGRILAGIPRLGLDERRPLTPIVTLTSALRSLGVQTSYNQLMFLGGGAFRMAWSSRWLPEAPFICGEDIVADAARSQGCTATTQFYTSQEGAWAAIAALIEGGVPILTSGALPTPDWVVIVGYEEKPRRLLLRDIANWSAEPSVKVFREWEGWTYAGYGKFPLISLRRVDKVMDERQATVEALDRAVRFSHEAEFTKQRDDGPGTRFHSGMRAYEEFARSAATMAVGATGDGLAARLELMWLGIRMVIDARQSAIESLELVKRRGSRQIYDVTVAIDRYAKEVQVLEQALAVGGREVAANAISAAGEEDRKAVAAISRVVRQLD